MLFPKPIFKRKKARNNPVPKDYKSCAVCGMTRMCETHEVYGGINRQISIEHEYQVPLCHTCHSDVTNNDDDVMHLQETWKKMFQQKQERKWVINGYTDEEARHLWMKRIGKNYL